MLFNLGRVVQCLLELATEKLSVISFSRAFYRIADRGWYVSMTFRSLITPMQLPTKGLCLLL